MQTIIFLLQKMKTIPRQNLPRNCEILLIFILIFPLPSFAFIFIIFFVHIRALIKQLISYNSYLILKKSLMLINIGYNEM